ncbi:hypothetical protein KSF73_01390 [Burkholderiaceae bacterium DAT-1]|nr:hypothetical protein [Burkholderiaceae bacterium DAT-1]
MSHALKQPSIRPYWERFPSFFAYPLSGAGIVPFLGFSISTLLVMLCAVLFSKLALILVVLLTLAWFKHLFMLLDRTAKGFSGDSLIHEAEHINLWIGVKHGFALMLAGIVVGLTVALSPVMGVIVGLFCLIAWPANVMRLALSGSFWDSINPFRLFEMMTIIGLPYLGLWACLAMLSMGSMALNEFLIRHMHTAIAASMCTTFAFQYFYMVMFRLMGYVVYQFHDGLGLHVRDIEGQPVREATEQEISLSECNTAVAAGQVEDALLILDKALRRYPSDLPLLNASLRLMLASSQAAERVTEIATRLMNLHLAARKHGPALDVIEQVAKLLPDLRPKAGEDTLALAKLAFQTRRMALSLRLIRGFDKAYPKHTALPEVMLLAAHISSDHQRNDAHARKLLEQLIRHFPNHPVREEAERFLMVLERIGTLSIMQNQDA